MLKLKSLPFFFITLYKNRLSTPNFFVVVLLFQMFSKTTIFVNHMSCFTPSLFKAPTLWFKLLERFSMMWVPSIACIGHANSTSIKVWIFHQFWPSFYLLIHVLKVHLIHNLSHKFLFSVGRLMFYLLYDIFKSINVDT